MHMSKVQACEKRRVAWVRPMLLGADSAINWLIVAVADETGEVGLGEASLERLNGQVTAGIVEESRQLLRQESDFALRTLRPSSTALSLSESAGLSALNQALWDLRARQEGKSLAQLVSGGPPVAPPLYANINRAINIDRSPEGFVEVARRAQEDGFRAIKIAPFDDVEHGSRLVGQNQRAFEAGLARIAAVVDALSVEVMVDLHWRFEGKTAVEAVAELDQFDLAWIEAPVREHDVEDWRRVRDSTSAVLAGAETLTHPGAFADFMRATGVDVVMPDIKYCGGVDGLRSILADASALGVQVSPHNPSGPVATLATIHASAGQRLRSLEVAWREESSPLDIVAAGEVQVPIGAGLGFTLPADVERKYPPLREPDFAPTDLI